MPSCRKTSVRGTAMTPEDGPTVRPAPASWRGAWEAGRSFGTGVKALPHPAPPSESGTAGRAKIAAMLAGGLTSSGIAVWFGTAGIGWQVVAGLPALLPAVAVHVLQLLASARAWAALIEPATPPDAPLPPAGLIFRARWVREAVNSLLPVAQIGGSLAAIRVVTARSRTEPAAAGASATVDLAMEVATQVAFLAAGLGCAVLLGAEVDALRWSGWAAVTGVLAVAALVAVQRFGLLQLVSALGRRLSPFGTGFVVPGLHDALVVIYADRSALARAGTWHFLSWSLGAAEVWIVLWVLGQPVGPGQAYAIESLGLAARSAGFAIPAGLGAQEAGFLFAGGLFGVPPDQAIALSMLKRLRELAVGLPGLLAWHWAERRNLLARGAAADQPGNGDQSGAALPAALRIGANPGCIPQERD